MIWRLACLLFGCYDVDAFDVNDSEINSYRIRECRRCGCLSLGRPA